MVEWARSAWKDGPYKRIIREMQVKTTMKYYLIDMRYYPIQTATVNKQNKTENNQCWWGCGEIGTCLHCWWESKLVRSLWTIGWRVLKKLKTKLLWKWRRLVFATPLQPSRPLHPWGFPSKNTGVGCHFLLEGIYPTHGLNSGLPHCGQTLYPLSHQGIP